LFIAQRAVEIFGLLLGFVGLVFLCVGFLGSRYQEGARFARKSSGNRKTRPDLLLVEDRLRALLVSLPVETLRLTLATVAAAPCRSAPVAGLVRNADLPAADAAPRRAAVTVARIHRACAGAKTGAAMAYSTLTL